MTDTRTAITTGDELRNRPRDRARARTPGFFDRPLTGWSQGAKQALEGLSDALRMEVARALTPTEVKDHIVRLAMSR